MDDELHIASFIARHHPVGIASLERIAESLSGLEIAAQEPTQSILVYECDGSREMLACMDAVQAADGVISVNLVYHHAERRSDLEEVVVQTD